MKYNTQLTKTRNFYLGHFLIWKIFNDYNEKLFMTLFSVISVVGLVLQQLITN